MPGRDSSAASAEETQAKRSKKEREPTNDLDPTQPSQPRDVDEEMPPPKTEEQASSSTSGKKSRRDGVAPPEVSASAKDIDMDPVLAYSRIYEICATMERTTSLAKPKREE